MAVSGRARARINHRAQPVVVALVRYIIVYTVHQANLD